MSAISKTGHQSIPAALPKPKPEVVAQHGHLSITTGSKDDHVSVNKNAKGNYDVSVNGVTSTHLASDVKNGISINTGGGNDNVTIGKGVNNVTLRTGNGNAHVENSGDKNHVVT